MNISLHAKVPVLLIYIIILLRQGFLNIHREECGKIKNFDKFQLNHYTSMNENGGF